MGSGAEYPDGGYAGTDIDTELQALQRWNALYAGAYERIGRGKFDYYPVKLTRLYRSKWNFCFHGLVE